MRRLLRSTTALTAAASLLAGHLAPLAHAETLKGVTVQPSPTADVVPYLIDTASDPTLPADEMAKLLRAKIKRVFVIFNENHSFDNEFGTFPGANGLFSDGYDGERDLVRPTDKTPGFTETVSDATDGISFQVSPFRMGLADASSAVDSVDHSHKGLAAKLHVGAGGVPAMDRFGQVDFERHAKPGVPNPPASIVKGVQYARLVKSWIDCETIPFMWTWASRFALFDNTFATEDTPSTPNAIAIIAGQAGESQWVASGRGETSFPAGTIAAGDFAGKPHAAGKTEGVPLMNDPMPFYGSQYDPTGANARQPSSPTDSRPDAPVATNITVASLPLTFMGATITEALKGNLSEGTPKSDLKGIEADIPFIAKQTYAPVDWRWYQEGYALEATDMKGAAAQGAGKSFTGTGTASHTGYVLHHNAVPYFGYLVNTPEIASRHLKGLTDFYDDMKSGNLPERGVFYIRGGFINQDGLQAPVHTNTALSPDEVKTVRAAKNGDDDHPGYTDRQISESMMARVINAIARDPKIWAESAIIITYDESDGFYDHVPPRILSYGPDKLPQARGVRVPLILISPYARTHVVSHAEGDHNAVIETINAVFGLPPLATLPEEAAALAKGNSPEFNAFAPAGFEQKYLGPRDLPSEVTDSLLSGFSPKRLKGETPPLPASMAIIPDADVVTLPHYGADACKVIGILPEDRRQGLDLKPPGPMMLTPTTGGAPIPVKAFNGLPGTLPGRN